jgi:hypothetical protein
MDTIMNRVVRGIVFPGRFRELRHRGLETTSAVLWAICHEMALQNVHWRRHGTLGAAGRLEQNSVS